VLNPGFEDTLFCPPGGGFSISAYEYWNDPNLGESADAFHVNNCPDVNWQFYIPNNLAGYAETRTGDGYVGVISYLRNAPSFIANYRETIQGRLEQRLDSNVIYCGGFYTQLADLSFGPIDAMGMYLNDSLLNIPGFPYNPTIYYPNPYISNPAGNYLSDTTDWMLVEQSFSAIGNERFLIVGNLNPYSTTNYIVLDSVSTSYYYIDDVFLYEQKPVYIDGNDTIVVCDTSVSNIIISADNAVHYTWYTLGDSTNVLSTNQSLTISNPLVSTQYIVQGRACGYTSYDTVVVEVVECASADQIILPNLISPNGDGKNDFYFISNYLPTGSKLFIFNRWGNEVYSSNNYQNNWDGTYMGKLLPTSTYFAVLELPNGIRKTAYIELMY